jgi:hypothetical protein
VSPPTNSPIEPNRKGPAALGATLVGSEREKPVAHDDPIKVTRSTSNFISTFPAAQPIGAPGTSTKSAQSIQLPLQTPLADLGHTQHARIAKATGDPLVRAAFAQAIQEVKAKTCDDGPWAMALVEANGDEHAAGWRESRLDNGCDPCQRVGDGLPSKSGAR